MAVSRIHIAGYRSIRDLDIPLNSVNVITGANGSGKSNLYQSLVLVAKAAQGGLARAISQEGGTPSLLWAGGERIRYARKKPAKRFQLAIESDLFSFEFSVGLPTPGSLPVMLPPRRPLFGNDPGGEGRKAQSALGGKTGSHDGSARPDGMA